MFFCTFLFIKSFLQFPIQTPVSFNVFPNLFFLFIVSFLQVFLLQIVSLFCCNFHHFLLVLIFSLNFLIYLKFLSSVLQNHLQVLLFTFWVHPLFPLLVSFLVLQSSIHIKIPSIEVFNLFLVLFFQDHLRLFIKLDFIPILKLVDYLFIECHSLGLVFEYPFDL